MTMLRAGGLLDVLTPLSPRIRRKDGTDNFGGFVYVLDGFPQRDFLLWVFMCSINFPSLLLLFCASLLCPLCLCSGYHAEGYHAPSIPHGLSRPYHHYTAITPVYISRLSRHSIFGNACFNIVVRINHDNVASRGAVGRTHTIVAKDPSKRWDG